MVRVKFQYRDALSNYEWRNQECCVESLEQCKKIYGLGTDPDCEYQIVSVEETKYATE